MKCFDDIYREIEIESLKNPTRNLFDDFFEEKKKRGKCSLVLYGTGGNCEFAMFACGYHKPEDIYELAQTILKIRDDYKLSFWQIGTSFWDMILYAV